MDETSAAGAPSARIRGRAALCLGAAILAGFLAGGMDSLHVPGIVVAATLIASLILFAMSVAMALYEAVRGTVLLIRPHERTWPGTLAALAAIVGHLAIVGFGMLVAYISTVGFARGRQLRRFGRVVLPGLRPDPSWTDAPMRVEASSGGGAPAEVGEQWRENGKTEHASVAAFARLTLDLMALGAPPTLIRAANQDALDEIRHAELCYSLARALDGRAVSPAPFPAAQRVGALPRSRTLALARLAVDSLVDGALHEGVSVRVIAKLARRAEVPAIRAALREIAADEGRHTAHGWAVVEWCLAEGGSAVAAALLGAIRTIPSELRSERPAFAAGGAWERWGIHGDALETAEYRVARAQLVARVRARVEASVRRAA
jgi:hypothetical protein